MLPRYYQIVNTLHNVERNIFRLFGHPPPGKPHTEQALFTTDGDLATSELALAYVHESKAPVPQKKFTLKDIVGDGFLYAVPKFRRTVEKRWKRKFGSPEYVWKMLVPKTNLIVCTDCGHHHEKGRLCGNCYKKVAEETKEIQKKIQENLGNKPIEQDVVVLYDGDSLPDQPKEFWQGKRIVEMKKSRPQWFSKNLLQKSTQKPSDSTAVKPTDLA